MKRKSAIETELSFLNLKKQQLQNLEQTEGVKKQIQILNRKIKLCKKEL